MNNKQLKSNSKGFTLIEIMVSVAIFAIIMTTGIGALVSLTNTYRVSQDNKKVNDSLNYALENMTRELRLGQNYRANAGSNPGVDISLDGESDSIGFRTADNRGYVVFRLGNDGALYRENITGGGFDTLTSINEVIIDELVFTVIGTDSLNGSPNNYQQPLVWIRIKASTVDGSSTSSIQTLVSQRVLDA